jgi:drug/metabolite transporter (DMT)-like permease
VVQDALATLSPHALLVARFGLAAASLAALGAAAGGLRMSAATWWAGAGAGAWLYAGFALQTLGLGFTTPARSGFLTGVYVLLVPLAQRLVLGVAVGPRVGLAAGVGFVGLALLTQPRAWADVNPGDVLTLLCALGFAGHVVALGRVAPHHPPLPLAVAQLAAVAALSVPGTLAEAVSGLELAPARAATGGPAALVGGVLFLGLVCSGGAYLAQSFAQRRVAPTPTALWLSLEALFAALVSVALGRERLGPLEWAGGALMLAALILAQLPARRKFLGRTAT